MHLELRELIDIVYRNNNKWDGNVSRAKTRTGVSLKSTVALPQFLYGLRALQNKVSRSIRLPTYFLIEFFFFLVPSQFQFVKKERPAPRLH